MEHHDFTEEKATQLGAGLVAVGVFGKASVVAKGICACTTVAKAGVVFGGMIAPPLAIGIGIGCIAVGLISFLGKRK